MIQKRTLFAAALCLHAPKSQAYSCPPPAIPNASASKENIQEAKVRDVTNLLSPRTSNEYLAFGVFTPKSNKPFAHTREIEERNAHHQANPNAETTGLIEYTYLRAIEFHGQRYFNGKIEPFKTDQTSITIWVDGYYGARLPPFGKTVLTKLTAPNNTSAYTKIAPQGCYNHPKADEALFKAVVACLQNPACN